MQDKGCGHRRFHVCDVYCWSGEVHPGGAGVFKRRNYTLFFPECGLLTRLPGRLLHRYIMLPLKDHIVWRRRGQSSSGRRFNSSPVLKGYYCSVLFSSVVPASLRPHGLQHTRLPCPLPSPGVCSNSCPLSR